MSKKTTKRIARKRAIKFSLGTGQVVETHAKQDAMSAAKRGYGEGKSK